MESYEYFSEGYKYFTEPAKEKVAKIKKEKELADAIEKVTMDVKALAKPAEKAADKSLEKPETKSKK